MKKQLVTLMLLWVAGFATACNRPHHENLTVVKANDGKTKLTDSELEAAIRVKLNRDQSFSRVKLIVDSENDQVTLLGTVESQRQRTRAIEIARNGNAELLVTDLIQVKSRAVEVR